MATTTKTRQRRRRRPVVPRAIRVNTYRLLADCVERGLQYGYRRAHKYNDTPSEAELLDAMQNAVMGDICEFFEFEEPAC